MFKAIAPPILLLALILAIHPITRAQEPPSQASAEQVITNTDIVRMAEAKLTDDLILSKIKTSTCDCDTSIDAILQLKNAGVSDTVIQAMVESGTIALPSDPNEPLSFGDAAPLVSVHVFTTSADFPYDFRQLQIQTIVELKKRNVSAGSADGTFALEGEVLEWSPGNRATRILIGLGTGRESAKIRFRLTDKEGTKVFERTDTIRQSVWGGGYAPSAGQLVQPFAIKIAERIADSRPVRQ